MINECLQTKEQKSCVYGKCMSNNVTSIIALTGRAAGNLHECRQEGLGDVRPAHQITSATSPLLALVDPPHGLLVLPQELQHPVTCI